MNLIEATIQALTGNKIEEKAEIYESAAYSRFYVYDEPTKRFHIPA